MGHAGFNTRPLRDAGFASLQLTVAWLNARQLQVAGCTALQLYDAGLDLDELKLTDSMFVNWDMQAVMSVNDEMQASINFS